MKTLRPEFTRLPGDRDCETWSSNLFGPELFPKMFKVLFFFFKFCGEGGLWGVEEMGECLVPATPELIVVSR